MIYICKLQYGLLNTLVMLVMSTTRQKRKIIMKQFHSFQVHKSASNYETNNLLERITKTMSDCKRVIYRILHKRNGKYKYIDKKAITNEFIDYKRSPVLFLTECKNLWA